MATSRKAIRIFGIAAIVAIGAFVALSATGFALLITSALLFQKLHF